jgi:hypothetical protein
MNSEFVMIAIRNFVHDYDDDIEEIISNQDKGRFEKLLYHFSSYMEDYENS